MLRVSQDSEKQISPLRCATVEMRGRLRASRFDGLSAGSSLRSGRHKKEEPRPLMVRGFLLGTRASLLAAVRITLHDGVFTLFVLALALHTTAGNLVGDSVQAVVRALIGRRLPIRSLMRAAFSVL